MVRSTYNPEKERPPTKRRRIERLIGSDHDHFEEPQCTTQVSWGEVGVDSSDPDAALPDNNRTPQPCVSTPERTSSADESIVCFGSIVLSQLASTPKCTIKMAVLLAGGGLLSTKSGDECGRLKTYDAEILEALREGGVELELVLSPTDHERGRTKVWITLYGSQDMGEDLGNWLQKLDVYLQDPLFAERDIKYCNPHAFGEDDRRTTDVAGLRTHNPQGRQQELSPTDLLAEFVSEDNLPETEGSRYLRTRLKSHQRRGLTFMLERERGWKLSRNETDIWSISVGPDGQNIFLNNVTNATQMEMPQEFKGGLLADAMGLGKSLSILSLIAHDKQLHRNQQPKSRNHRTVAKMVTLIVVPPILLRNWETEISCHLASNRFSWRRHHGPYRLVNAEDILHHDIVLITYSTLAAEYRNQRETSILFTHKWGRVVLDEAHYIKNASSATAQAVFALQADRRWAVTGTPFQNRLSELSSLFQFLQAHPYSSRSVFDSHIGELWAGGREDEAISRLKKLLKFTMLRRAGSVITLPQRSDRRIFLRLGAKEQGYYDEARERAVRCLDDILFSSHPSGGYINALSKLNTLRMICNLGCHADLDGSGTHGASTLEVFSDRTVWDAVAAKAAFDDFPLLGIPYTCANCQESVDFGSASAGEYLEAGLSIVSLTSCFRLRCAACTVEISTSPSTETYCSCEPPCPAAQFMLEGISQPGTPSRGPLQQGGASVDKGPYPIKIQALLEDLSTVESSTKSIVFSFWKSTLDLVNLALSEAGISCFQIDGKVPSKRRAHILDKFSKSRQCQVLLLSLSCGAVGLTLTAASRVYLMEPQWNPSLEEQALARVHRLGQIKEVTTIRFVIEDSIEKYVLDIQDGKKDLSNLLFGPKGSSGSQLSQDRLKQLRNLLR